MPAFLARLLRRLTPTTLSAQLAGMLIGGILLLHGVATVTVQRVEERQAARSALLEQANSLALSLQLLHSEPFEYKRSLLERLERLDVVHLSLGDAPNPARQAQDERALYLRDRLRKNLNSIETDLDTREMLTEVQRVHVADSMNPTLRRHVPWTHVYESRVSVRLDDGKWLCVVISSDAYDFSPSQASLAMLLLEAGLLILLILVVVHRMVRPLRVLSGKAESFGRNLYTAPLPEDGPTEVREAARAFNKMQERIRAGVGQHERILAAVAHDLRTPLTRIRLRVEGMDPASPLRAKLLGDIDILGGIMANSAELTRGSARDEAAVRMDMNALLDSLVSDRQDMGQDVMLEGHCRQPWTVRPNSLRRCLSNLLDNALRYSARVRIRLLEKADVLQIDVLDDGPGIPPEMLEQVFEPFFRLDEARSPHTGGSGLGLSIARSMACRNGGELSLHNRPEGGLCARLCLYRSAMEMPGGTGGKGARTGAGGRTSPKGRLFPTPPASCRIFGAPSRNGPRARAPWPLMPAPGHLPARMAARPWPLLSSVAQAAKALHPAGIAVCFPAVRPVPPDAQGDAMKNFLTLQSVETVLGHLRALPVLPAETVPLTEALGRRLAEALHAPADLPGFDRSTVDGFAVRARDVFGAQEGSPALLECVGDCPMGAVPDIRLQPGQCARILTGGMLPEGADCVVMVEYSRPAGGNMVELTRTQAPGDHVVMRDEDAAAGDCIIPAGRRLRPQEIGLLASFGQRDVAVRRAPRVAVISTGDEVVPIESEPRPGQVRDVNSYSLAALCRSAGAEPTLAGLVRDDAEALRRTVLAALDGADVVVVSGGSSAGMRDHTVDVFTSVPGSELLTHGVAISPGKPFILARSGGKCLMGLPGHVSSALVCARAFLVPLLEHLQGSAGDGPAPSLTARLARAVASAQGRRDYIRVRLVPVSAAAIEAAWLPRGLDCSDVDWLAQPLMKPSGVVSGLVEADGLVICAENREGLTAGERVRVELLS